MLLPVRIHKDFDIKDFDKAIKKRNKHGVEKTNRNKAINQWIKEFTYFWLNKKEE